MAACKQSKEVRKGDALTISRFLLAKFHLESLCGKRSVKAVRIALENLPTGSRAYDCAYGDAMKRIESQVRDQEELAKQVISWITRATRRLKATELQYALAVEVGEAIFDEDNLPQLDDMVSSCAGLVTVDKESNVIRLVHYTAQEYFTRTWKQWFPHTEAEITAICCTYLSLETFRCGPCKTNKEYEQRLEENPVFEYAAQNWGLHASNTEAPCQEIIRFLQSTANVEATTQALFVPRDEKGWNPNYYTRFPARFRGLHLAAYFGLAHEAMLLLKNEISNMQDANDRPSRCSASNSQKRFLRPPFETDSIDADSSDSDGLTPLAWAARNGCADVVKLLLESGKTNPDSKDKYGRTPLAWAAAKNHLTVAELLLAKKGVDANSKTCYPHGGKHFISTKLL